MVKCELCLVAFVASDAKYWQLYNLKFPDAVGINPKVFTLETFEPPTTNHHSSAPPPPAFSSFNTSNTTIRFRRAPSDESATQSNARILRWSDGSFTLQLASNPLQQYLLAAKPLAPPQINPDIPTPTSIHVPNMPPNTKNYNPSLDSHEYLAAPHEHAGILRHTTHFTTALTVQSSEQDDEALLRLQESLAAASRGNKASADGGPAVISITEDPELAKKRAELAEKEKVKMQRRLQSQQERETSRANNVLRRSGLRTGGMSTGLTVGGLEDEGGMGAGRARVPKSKSKRPRRRNSEYSEDEDDYRGGGRNREHEYDEDDPFVAGSDEEIEVGEDDSEEEADLDAEGEDDDEIEVPEKKDNDAAATGGGRLKKKRVIEDEDED